MNPRILEDLRTQNMISNADEETTELNEYIESLTVGALLMHRKYEQGTIKEINGEGIDKEFTIFFSSINKTKRILAYHSLIIKPDNNL